MMNKFLWVENMGPDIKEECIFIICRVLMILLLMSLYTAAMLDL